MDIDELIARRLAALRKERELTLAQLAERCAVSKAMISRIERNQSSPTASVLGRLAGGLGVALSELLGDAQAPAEPLCRRAQQEVWKTRPAATAAARSALATAQRLRDGGSGDPGERPPRLSPLGRPALPAAPVAGRGALRVDYGEQSFHLQRGDRLDFGVDRAVTFATAGQACRYLLVILHD